MMTDAHPTRILLKNLALMIFLFSFNCLAFDLYPQNPQGIIEGPKGVELKASLAITLSEKVHGLSGYPADKFKDDQGLLFLYREVGPRKFIMPDTYFDLDIIFLSEKLEVIQIERNLKAHPGRSEKLIPIQSTPVINAQHVLEVKAGAAFSKDLKKGDQLKWKNPRPLPEIIRDIPLER